MKFQVATYEEAFKIFDGRRGLYLATAYRKAKQLLDEEVVGTVLYDAWGCPKLGYRDLFVVTNGYSKQKKWEFIAGGAVLSPALKEDDRNFVKQTGLSKKDLIFKPLSFSKLKERWTGDKIELLELPLECEIAGVVEERKKIKLKPLVGAREDRYWNWKESVLVFGKLTLPVRKVTYKTFTNEREGVDLSFYSGTYALVFDVEVDFPSKWFTKFEVFVDYSTVDDVLLSFLPRKEAEEVRKKYTSLKELVGEVIICTSYPTAFCRK